VSFCRFHAPDQKLKRRSSSFFVFRTSDQNRKIILSVFCVATILVKAISEETSSLFHHPILENNGMTQVTFDFFTLVKLRALSLASEEVIFLDNVSP